MLSENMMGTIFRIAETAHRTPTSIYYVHVTVIFVMVRQPKRALGLLHEVPRSQTLHTQTLLDEWSTRRRDLCLTQRNTHKRQTNLLPAGFEPAAPVSERPQSHALDRASTAIGDA